MNERLENWQQLLVFNSRPVFGEGEYGAGEWLCYFKWTHPLYGYYADGERVPIQRANEQTKAAVRERVRKMAWGVMEHFNLIAAYYRDLLDVGDEA